MSDRYEDDVSPAHARGGRAHPGGRGSAGCARWRRATPRGAGGGLVTRRRRGRRPRRRGRTELRVATVDADPTWSANVGDRVPRARGSRRGPRPTNDEPVVEDQPTGEVPPLPHWTEPPTGAVPAIFADDRRRRRRARRRGRRRAARSRASGPRAPTGPRPTSPRTCRGEHDERSARSPRRAPSTRTRRSHATSPQRRTPRGRAARTMVTTPPAATARRRPRRRTGRRAARRPTTRRPPSAGPRRPRPADGDHDRGRRSRSSRSSASRRARTGPSVLAAVDRRRSRRSSSRNALQTRGLPSRDARSRCVACAYCCRSRRKHYGTAAYPVFFALDRRRSRCCGSCGRSRRAGRCSASRRTVLAFAYVGGLGGFAGLAARVARRRRPHPRRRALRDRVRRRRLLRRFAVRPHADRAEGLAEQDASRARVGGHGRRRSSSAASIVGPDRTRGTHEHGPARSACSSRSARSSATSASR